MAASLPVYYATACDGARIAYTVTPGNGPPFLFVATPGSPPIAFRAGQAEHIWAPFVGDRMAVGLEFRGGGQSDRRLPASLDDLVLDLEAVTNAIGEPPDVVTHTYGCFAACAFAAGHDGKWRSLMLVDASLRPESNVWAYQNRPGWSAHYKAHLAAIAAIAFPWMPSANLETLVVGWANAVPPEAFAASLAALVDLSDTLPRITIPAMVTGLAMKGPDRRVAALLPNSTLVHIEAADRGDWRHLRKLWDTHIGTRLDVAPERAAGLSANGRLSGLTQRETEVLAYVAAGTTNSEAAARLSISEKTVARHIANIYTKLNVHNRVEAANWAREHGVV